MTPPSGSGSSVARTSYGTFEGIAAAVGVCGVSSSDGCATADWVTIGTRLADGHCYHVV